LHLLAQRGDARVAGEGCEHQRRGFEQAGHWAAGVCGGPEERQPWLRALGEDRERSGNHKECERKKW
jgi:hypothetical protein